ncbi:putative leucine-rich repeat-containing protein DDB_G0290503 [Eucalyptus grandis]|uniref:putative leucine-rich repeat-containing protein DDB_G0290503 n=1 Tax=Eucalyptus grandis TaxID=71139 RepID=UPI00192EA5D8|nr:putative leucine-rich repeat-containing protein DDB_G0290503 [Eucalyptus grandis]XP_010048983.2 putative leucine-rich repeat-containing protein DDB_G0290503 [Eucalyptus grandis]
MDERKTPDSCLSSLFLCEEKVNDWYPMYFGVSCAFFALRLLPGRETDDDKWSKAWNTILQGSAQLLGLLVWKAQKEGTDEGKGALLAKLEMAERERDELKRIRHEDAKANEKVVSIFAAQEQRWFNEKKKLQQQIRAVVNGARVLGKKKDEEISGLNERLKEMELVVQSKDKELQEEGLKRKELEEKLKKTENTAEELRENAKREAKEHASEIWKHKTAFIELVSNQRQIEAEMGRAHRQVETTKQELELVLEQKEESDLMIEKLSVEIVKMQKDLEQKGDILSAMLRKSKLDAAEREMLLKEIKLSKAKRKQAELETERLRSASESKHGGHSLRSMLANQVNLKLEGEYGTRKMNSCATGSSLTRKARLQANNLLEYENPNFSGEIKACSPEYDGYSQGQTEALAITADVKRLEHWVHSEAEKYATLVEERHHLELNAFVEQMRLKDEKLEGFRWRMLSMEIESKRLRSHVEGLTRDISQLKNTNTKLEALLLAREDELSALKEQLASQSNHINFQRPLNDPSIHDRELVEDTIWSEVNIVKRRPGHKDKKADKLAAKASQEEDVEVIVETALVCQPTEVTRVQSPQKVSEEQKDIGDCDPKREESGTSADLVTLQNLPSLSQISSKTKSSSWKMDLHALGVSYKIKRLKQQLLMLERLMGKQESSENVKSKDHGPNAIKGFLSLVSLLTKQVGRYQSLQEKADDLCKRMHENNLDASSVDSNATKSRGRIKTLENFLEETFQLQRYMVATGQKLMEIQSKITIGFVGAAEELAKSASFDIKRFADGVRTLFQEIQRGLEVRIARIIGDLEGTLACDGIIHLRR